MNWGHKIIVLYVVFMFGILFMVYKCTQQKVDLVTDKYYEREIKYQDQYDGMTKSNTKEYHADIVLNSGKTDLTINYPANNKAEQVNGEIYFFKPDNANLDFSVQVQVDSNNQQIIPVNKLAKGTWRVQMSWNQAQVKLYQEEKILLQLMNVLFWSAITLGFLGSFHCVGMCGPIALALPSPSEANGGLLIGRFLYNIGRIFTYGLLGLIAGFIGKSFSFIGWQNNLSVITGIIIILFVLFSNDRIGKLLNGKLAKITIKIKKRFSFLFKRHSYSSLLFIGLLNGILPCGFVYLAIAGAIATANPLNSAIYMMLFGLGTFPFMLILSITGSFISISARSWVKRLSPLIAISLALLLIQRGSTQQLDSHKNCNASTKIEMINLQNCK